MPSNITLELAHRADSKPTFLAGRNEETLAALRD